MFYVRCDEDSRSSSSTGAVRDHKNQNYTSKVSYMIRLILKLMKGAESSANKSNAANPSANNDNTNDHRVKILIFSERIAILNAISIALKDNDIKYRCLFTVKNIADFKVLLLDTLQSFEKVMKSLVVPESDFEYNVFVAPVQAWIEGLEFNRGQPRFPRGTNTERRRRNAGHRKSLPLRPNKVRMYMCTSSLSPSETLLFLLFCNLFLFLSSKQIKGNLSLTLTSLLACRTTTIHRFIINNTIEQNIFNYMESLKLINSKHSKMENITLDVFLNLFSVDLQSNGKKTLLFSDILLDDTDEEDALECINLISEEDE